ncbi:hypothetical protein [Clostridium felsineum]|uniref:hypothetical protein n=1 Tax=Clostridium felsineum TaxID=36839 RepID=UPI0020341A12|nr:hypothetical protein [Clostridium felsineum]
MLNKTMKKIEGFMVLINWLMMWEEFSLIAAGKASRACKNKIIFSSWCIWNNILNKD